MQTVNIQRDLYLPIFGVRNRFRSWKEWKLSFCRNIHKIKVWCLFWCMERGRREFLISSEQWNSLEQWSLNKFFTSKYVLPNEKKYEQHSWQGITACSHLLWVKLMNLLLDLEILFDLPHSGLFLSSRMFFFFFFSKFWKYFVKTTFASVKKHTMGSNF